MTANKNVTVRPCRDEADRAEAMRIRFAVFVDEQQVPAELEADEYDADALHLLAVSSRDGTALGTARLVDKNGGVAKIGRVAVLPAYRGRGVGAALMDFVLEEARRNGFSTALLDAQVPVIPFYERLGFVPAGPVFDDAGIDHRHMTLKLTIA